MLIEHESLLQERVKLYLRMNSWDAALRTALASGESGMLFDVVLHIKTRMVAGSEEEDMVRVCNVL